MPTPRKCTALLEYYTTVKRSDIDAYKTVHLSSAYHGITGQISVLWLMISNPPPCSNVGNACLRTQEGFCGNLYQ